jgi:hypothetical protein
MTMTTTTDAIDAIEDTAFPEPDDQAEPTLLPDPTLTGLIWALCLGAGRMPLFP